MVLNLNFILKAVVIHIEIFSRVVAQIALLNLLRDNEEWRKIV